MDLKKWKMFDKLDPILAAGIGIGRVHLIGISSREDQVKKNDGIPWKGSVIVTKNNDVYTLVSNLSSVSLLGVNKTRGLRPLVPVKISALCGLQIRAISSGASHIDALIGDGRIYQWGSICEGNNTFKALKPQFLSGSLNSRKVVQIVCGSTHSLALTQEGEVYSWGYDDCGQLGIGRHSMETDPVKVSGFNGFRSKVVSVACTGWTSFAVDADGNVIRIRPRTIEDVLELFKLASKYAEEDLKRACEKQLEALMAINNVCAPYALAIKQNSKGLQDLTVDFIVANYNDVVKTDGYLKMPNELKNKLTLGLAAEDTFVGLKRKWKK